MINFLPGLAAPFFCFAFFVAAAPFARFLLTIVTQRSELKLC